MSLKMQTPDVAHLQEGNQVKLWKLKVYKKYRPHPVQNWVNYLTLKTEQKTK